MSPDGRFENSWVVSRAFAAAAACVYGDARCGVCKQSFQPLACSTKLGLVPITTTRSAVGGAQMGQEGCGIRTTMAYARQFSF